MALVQALILAGGTGTRFWPLSRRSRPKQLLALEGEKSLLRATAERVDPLIRSESIWVCTTEALADQVADQLPEVPRRQILAEPAGRDTAAAIGWSTQCIAKAVGDEVIVVLPADHRVGRADAFRATLEAADRIAADERVLALGVEPRWAETGYGYLELGEVLDAATNLRRVIRFTEKPDASTAKRFVEGGSHWWNGGVFVFRAGALLGALERHQPELAARLEEIGRRPEAIQQLYPELPRISIDHGVMEHLEDLCALPLDCEWSDLGGWEALAEFLPTDAAGNASRGEVLALDAHDNLLYADHGTVAAVGVSNLVIVKTGDSVLVVPRERAQEVRRVTEELEGRGSDELL